MSSLRTVLPLVIAVFPMIGCSITGPPRVVPEEDRARLGAIAIRAAPSTPEVGLFDPFGGYPADLDTGRLAAGPSYDSSPTYGGPGPLITGPYGVEATAALLGIMLIIIPIVAAINRIPDEKAAEIGSYTQTLLGQRAVGDELMASVIGAAFADAGVALTVADLPPEGDTEDGCPANGTAYDQVLDIRVPRYGFAGTGGSDPSLALFLNVEAKLSDTATCRVLYADRLAYVSERRKFSAWSADATLVHDAVSRGLKGLAERIGEDVFLLHPSEE